MRRIVLLFLILPFVTPAQHVTLSRRPDLMRFADGVIYTYKAPARWNQKQWLTFGGIVAGTAALTLADDQVRSFWLQQDNRVMDGLERIGYHYGKPYTAVGLASGLYLTGLITRDPWWRETGLMLTTSLFSSTVLMTLIKDAAGRARPSALEGNYEFEPFRGTGTFHAFPSGHSSVAFTISMVMARRIDNLPAKILFYGLAATTAASRLYVDAHWISDVSFGGVLAWACAEAAMTRLQTNRYRLTPAKDVFRWKVYPYAGGLSLVGTLR